MNGQLYLYSLMSLFKGIVTAIVALIGTYIGHSLVVLVGFNVPTVSTLFENVKSLFYFLLIIVLSAILVGELFKMLRQPFVERFICIFTYHLFFFYVLRAFDDFLYSEEMGFSYDLICHIVSALLFSFVVAMLWRPDKKTASLAANMKTYFRNKKPMNWVVRIGFGGISFIAIYYLAYWFIAPFVEPFYIDVDMNQSSLLITNLYVKIAMKFIIGLLFVIILLPIFILWSRSKTSLLFWVGFPIFVQGAVYPSVVELWLPLGLRFPYLIQYTVVMYLMAIVLVQLFFVPEESEIIDDQFKWMY